MTGQNEKVPVINVRTGSYLVRKIYYLKAELYNITYIDWTTPTHNVAYIKFLTGVS